MKNIVDKLLATAGLTPVEAYPAGVRIRVLLIGPEEARALLSANTDNRPLRNGRVNFYARTMKNGAWMFTHQGIAFSEDGLGIDLQHRLHAVILSGVTVRMMVTEGISREAFEAIDQHERRSMADSLKMRRTLTDEARLFITLRGGDQCTNPTIQEVGEVASQIEEASNALDHVCSTRTKVFSSAPVRCAAIMLMMEKPGVQPYVLNAYRAMVLSHSETWMPAMHAFGRQIAGGVVSTTGGLPRIDLVARALIALDPARAETKRIQIDKGFDLALRERVKRVIFDGMDLEHVKISAPKVRSRMDARQGATP